MVVVAAADVISSWWLLLTTTTVVVVVLAFLVGFRRTGIGHRNVDVVVVFHLFDHSTGTATKICRGDDGSGGFVGIRCSGTFLAGDGATCCGS